MLTKMVNSNKAWQQYVHLLPQHSMQDRYRTVQLHCVSLLELLVVPRPLVVSRTAKKIKK